MKYKKYASVLLCTAAVLLVSVSVMPGSRAAYKSDKNPAQNEKPEYTINEKSVSVSYQGNTQAIPITFKDRLTDEEIKVSVEDYNFDGWLDIHLYGKSDRGTLGTYWLWDPDDEKYCLAENMAIQNGLAPYFLPLSSEKKLVYYQNRDRLEYILSDSELKPIRFRNGFYEDLRELRLYNYSLDENNDLILESWQICKSEGIFDAEEHKTDEDYIRVTDSAVEHMKGSKVIQILSIADIFGKDLKPLKISAFPGFKEEIYGISVTRLDLDFDGTDDLCVKLNAREPDQSERYSYYLMNKKTGMYEKMEKLSADGRLFTPDPFEKCLYYTEYINSETNQRMYNYYRWENDTAVLRKHEELTALGGKSGYEVKVVRYDDDGNEYLSPT